MRFRLVLFLSALAAMFAVGTTSAVADSSYGDKAVADDVPTFRLNPYTLEPGCYLAKDLAGAHVDIGDTLKSAHITVRPRMDFSVDQALVPGKKSGYVVYNAFDTGTVNNDPDIDPDQTGVNLEAAGDDVEKRDIVVCISDHEDSGQNEPYEQAADGEVAAKNRPIIQPTIAALGVSAIEPLNTYKLGFGYSIERWYAPHIIADSPPFELALTDPQAFAAFTHVFVKTRAEQPGVRRINDIDDFGESFADPHSEKSDHGQPEVFNMNGDPQAYLHNSVTAPDGSGRGPLGLLTFSTEGDLPISWTVKASLAPERYTRDVDLTDDEFRAWERSWQAYYCGGPKPTMALAPGTNAPAPRPSTCVVNPPPPAPPAPPAVTNNTTIIQSAPAATVSNRCVSGRSVRLALSKKAQKGAIRYVGSKGVRTVKARRSNGRLRATADFRGVSADSGTYAAVSVREKMKKGGWRERTLLLKLC